MKLLVIFLSVFGLVSVSQGASVDLSLDVSNLTDSLQDIVDSVIQILASAILANLKVVQNILGSDGILNHIDETGNLILNNIEQIFNSPIGAIASKTDGVVNAVNDVVDAMHKNLISSNAGLFQIVTILITSVNPNGIGAVLSDLTTSISNIIISLLNGGGKLISALTKIFGTGFVVVSRDNVGLVISSIVKTIQAALKLIGDLFLGIIQGGLQLNISFISEIFQIIRGLFRSTLNIINVLVIDIKNVINGVANAQLTLINDLNSTLNFLVEGISNFVKNVLSFYIKGNVGILDSIIDGFSGLFLNTSFNVNFKVK